MSETAEQPATKVVDEESATLVDKPNENQSGKRGRSDSLNSPGTESPRKMRKKLQHTKDTVSRQDDEKLDDTDISAIAPSNNSQTNGAKDKDKDKNFDFENDSAFLNDLLEDFYKDPCELGDALPSSKQTDTTGQSTPEKQTQSKEKTDKGISDFAGDLQNLEFDGEFDDLFDEAFEDVDQCTDGGVEFLAFKWCRVIEINRTKCFTRIRVEEISEKKTATVLCYGFWKDVFLEVNEVVSIKATKKLEKWTVDNDDGFLITQPHTLVSGTSVVGSHFCLRRGVLAESFRGLDVLPNVESGISPMTIGTLVHEVLQKVLRKKLSTIDDIRKTVKDALSSRRTIQMLYESDMSQRECEQQMEVYIPKIFDFVKRYVIGDRGKTQDDNFLGKIERIREIEENVWVPELGLKGKIDATVDVIVNVDRKIMPLEVKSGQPSFSVEHRGQLMLYNMMLSFVGYHADAGLLLYIRDNIVKEVKNNHPEERDLILLRNSFAYYVSKRPEFEEIEKEDGVVEKVWKDTTLPEPINHRVACSKCPYNILCAVYAEKDSSLELSESHVLKSIRKDSEEVLTAVHIEYVLKWIVMTKLEDTVGYNTLKDIWVMEPQKREKKGICVSNLRVCGNVEEKDNRYVHTFERKSSDDNFSDINQTTFSEGDYVIVSTNTRINVSSGYIKSQSNGKIKMLLDRNIVKQNPGATFHLDKYPLTGLSKLCLANIACLLNNHEITNKLRGIVIDRQPATFVPKLPRSVAEVGASILYSLNKYQRQAVLKVLSANDYVLIRGMPGTGKTQTLVALIELLVKMGSSVLVTAHTHSAVDNILLKLRERGTDFLRLGSTQRMNPKLIPNSEDVLTAKCETVESLKAAYRSKNVVGVTCYGANHVLLSKRIFDVCLVDESTQVTQSTILKPIYSAKKFVLVGDPEQLSPVVKNRDAIKMGMTETLFSRLDSESNTVTLKLQYRMNRRLMSVANDMTYKGAMKAGTDQVANATLPILDTMVLESCEKWISRALSLNLEDSVVVLNTGQTCELREKYGSKFNIENNRIHNVLEAVIVMRLLAVLLKGGIDEKSIGIICPYVAQVNLLRSMCQEDIEVNTVDQYQGRDKDVIIFSCTKSEPATSDDPTEFEILQDHQRLNVAVTRAKCKFIVVCDKMTLNRYAPFKKLFSVVKNDIINLNPGRDNFSWENLVQLIK